MNFTDSITPGDGVAAGLVANAILTEGIEAPHLVYGVQCLSPGENREEYLHLLAQAERAKELGDYSKAIDLRAEADALRTVAWEETFHNLVTNEGRNDLINKYFKGSSYTAAWYLGLKGAGSAAAGDTLASHAGWSEVTPYSGNRPAITWGTTSSQSNTATAVSISITGTSTVAGAFVGSVNTGTSGILYSAGDFSASRSVASGDTLNVTPTVTT